jgi:hypothetical protein
MSYWRIAWIALAVAVGSWILLTVLIRATRPPAQPQRVWTPPTPAYQPVAAPAYTPPQGWQPPPSPVTPSPVTQDPYARLEKLGELHRTGVITDAEFEAKKKEILDA